MAAPPNKMSAICWSITNSLQFSNSTLLFGH